jgi:hypothetical protein
MLGIPLAAHGVIKQHFRAAGWAGANYEELIYSTAGGKEALPMCLPTVRCFGVKPVRPGWGLCVSVASPGSAGPACS